VLHATTTRRIDRDDQLMAAADHRTTASDGPALSAEEQELVERLLAGQSLGQASNAMHVSRRTADRRIAAARQALGVRTTAELLGAVARTGVRPRVLTTRSANVGTGSAAGRG
jgi:DNA-binding NarL/FixJ family response regulator